MVVRTPPMGWNTWNTFGLDINEKLILESAQVLISSGLRDAGYDQRKDTDNECKRYQLPEDGM